MDKLSADKQRAILTELPDALRKVAAERDFYKEAHMKLVDRLRAEKLASSMLTKGLCEGDVQSVADELQKQASAGSLDLDVTERAVDLVGPDMGKVATVSEKVSGGASDLEAFILS